MFLLNYSSDAVLELEPMNSYSRLLLHRLAEIFGYFLTNLVLCKLTSNFHVVFVSF